MSFKTTDLETKMIEEKVVIVTGGNTGIGYEAAKCLALESFHVIIACRSKEKAEEAINDMKKETTEETKFKNISLKVEFMELDLSSLRNTMAFIEQFKQRGLPLHVLLCNAGISMVPFGLTEDNFENHFQVNYLSHLLIMLHLLPVMLATPCDDVRIVMVSSLLHYVGTFNLDNIQGDKSYGRQKFYGNSKLFQVMLGLALGRRLAGTKVTISSAHPGYVRTTINRGFSDSNFYSFFFSLSNKLRITITPKQGAANVLEPIINPERKGVNGLYYSSKKPTSPSRTSRKERNQEALWKYSLECLRDYIDDDLLTTAGVLSSSEKNAPTDMMY